MAKSNPLEWWRTCIACDGPTGRTERPPYDPDRDKMCPACIKKMHDTKATPVLGANGKPLRLRL